MEEQPERGSRGSLALGVGAEHVEHGDRPAGLHRLAHAAQQRDDLLGGEVVDDVEHQRAVVGAAEVGLEHVAVAVLDAIAHAGSRR